MAMMTKTSSFIASSAYAANKLNKEVAKKRDTHGYDRQNINNNIQCYLKKAILRVCFFFKFLGVSPFESIDT